MNTKKAKKFALPFVMVIALLMALSSPAMADLPTEDGYLADHKKMNIYKQGAGDLTYSYGALSVSCPDGKEKPYYCCIWNYNETTGTNETATYTINLDSVPANAEARLYVYWTWSKFDEYDPYSSRDYGIYPELEVEFNGTLVSFDNSYTDVKNSTYFGLHYGDPNYEKYNFPSGTNCAMIDIEDVGTSNVVDVTNVYPYNGDDPDTLGDDMAKVCIQNVGLLLILEDEDKMYWIAEGNDMTYCRWYNNAWKYGIDPEMTITKVKFSGKIASGMDTATLTTVVPAGNTPYNRLYFNALSEYYWDGLWNANPDPNFAVNVTDVSAALRSSNNMARFQNGLWSAPLDTERGDRQMNVANAFLVVE
jgi:hypothetical protein